MEYLRKKFGNYDVIKDCSLEGHIEWYQELARQFNNHPSMEANVLMTEEADILIKHFGLSPDDIEALEIEQFKKQN